jgi:hypothetical protein
MTTEETVSVARGGRSTILSRDNAPANSPINAKGQHPPFFAHPGHGLSPFRPRSVSSKFEEVFFRVQPCSPPRGWKLRDMGQKVLRAERRARRGWPRPARSTTGYGLCSFLDMADAHGLALAVVHLPADGRRAGNCICRTAPPPSRQCALAAADDRRSESTGWPPARLCDRTSSRLRPSRRS